MTNVDIVIVCSNGRNRSRLLKQYLYEKGHYSYAIGASNKSLNAQQRIKRAKIIIPVHPEIERELNETHDLEGKKVICLNVEELTTESLQGKKLSGENWLEYQQTQMYPELKRQIDKHLPALEKML